MAWELDKIYWLPENTRLAITQSNAWTLALTTWINDEVNQIVNKPKKSQEELQEELIERLEKLDSRLLEATGIYKEIFWENFGGINAAIMNIEYGWFEYPMKVDTKNIQILALFSFLEIYSEKEQLNFFHRLIAKLKHSDSEMQAHLLWYIELLSVHVINTKYNIPKEIEWNESEIQKRRIELQKLYEQMLKNIFDLTTGNYVWMLKKTSIKLHEDINSWALSWEGLFNKLVDLFWKPVFGKAI